MSDNYDVATELANNFGGGWNSTTYRRSTSRIVFAMLTRSTQFCWLLLAISILLLSTEMKGIYAKHIVLIGLQILVVSGLFLHLFSSQKLGFVATITPDYPHPTSVIAGLMTVSWVIVFLPDWRAMSQVTLEPAILNKAILLLLAWWLMVGILGVVETIWAVIDISKSSLDKVRKKVPPPTRSHTSKKGKKGYDRSRDKKGAERDASER